MFSSSLNIDPNHSFDYSSSELSGRYNGEKQSNGMIESPYLFITEGESLAQNIMNYETK